MKHTVHCGGVVLVWMDRQHIIRKNNELLHGNFISRHKRGLGRLNEGRIRQYGNKIAKKTATFFDDRPNRLHPMFAIQFCRCAKNNRLRGCRYLESNTLTLVDYFLNGHGIRCEEDLSFGLLVRLFIDIICHIIRSQHKEALLPVVSRYGSEFVQISRL